MRNTNSTTNAAVQTKKTTQMSQTAAKTTKTTQTFELIKKPETPKDYDLIKLKYDNAKGNIKLLEGYKADLKKYPNSEHKERWIARIA